MHNMRIFLFVGVAALESLAGVYGASAQVVQGEEHCVVNVASWDRLNVRDEPSVGGHIVTKHRYGDCGLISTSDIRNGWVRIEDGHFEGWVNSKFISMVSPALYCVSEVDGDDTSADYARELAGAGGKGGLRE